MLATDGIQLAELVNQPHFIGCHCHGIQIAVTVKDTDICVCPLHALTDLFELQEMPFVINIYEGGELATHCCTQSPYVALQVQ